MTAAAWRRSDVHGGTDGLTTAIESLDQQLAERALRLSERGCDVTLSVCQELADNSESTGLHLSPAAVRWLAAAGAAIDVDQYVDDGSDAT